MTVYKPGDELYERTTQIERDYKAKRIVRTWTVLSAVIDPLYTDEAGEPLQVVTLRAFTPKQAIYKAELALYLDIEVEHGTWHRSFDEAFATLRKTL